jgi:hypothetical protein
MRAAGEWAARIGSASDKEFPSFKAFSRHRAEEAARLLAIYTALHGSGQYICSFDPTPEALKATASRSYQRALRDERERQPRQDESSSPPAPALEPEPNFSPDSPTHHHPSTHEFLPENKRSR